jgi:NADH-quinone oxidoreductase subunit M
VVGFAAALGLPGLVGFWGEFWSMYAAWSPAPDRPAGLFHAFAVVAVIGTALAAGYALRVLRTVWAGERREPHIVDAHGAEGVVVGLLVAATIVLGVVPGPLLDTTLPEVSQIVTGVAP